MVKMTLLVSRLTLSLFYLSASLGYPDCIIFRPAFLSQTARAQFRPAEAIAVVSTRQ